MATYYDIFGQKVQYLSSDPANLTEGQVWYNSTSNTAKVQGVTASGSWATGGNLNTARWFAHTNGAGTQTEGIVYGGIQEPTPGYKTETEDYNGTTWSEVNDINTARVAAGAGGSYTSALMAGGQPGSQTASESWNGSVWTNTPSLNTGRGYLAGSCESETAGIVYGGFGTPTNGVANTEEFNGVSWSEVNDLNSARRSNSGLGTSTSGFALGGYDGASTGVCEHFDGTCWANVNSQNQTGASAAFGNYASAAAHIAGLVNTEVWDGTCWAADTNSPNTISNKAALGTSSAGLETGGEPPNAGVGNTYEYTGAGVAETRTITTS